MKEVLVKRKQSCCEKTYGCVNCCCPYYEFDVNNYTQDDVYVIASYKKIEPSKIRANISATGGGVGIDMHHKDINATVRLSPNYGDDIENKNTHTLTIPKKDCYISVYMIHPSNFNSHGKNLDAWTAVSENKYIKLSRYSAYNITFSEEKVPPLSFVPYP